MNSDAEFLKIALAEAEKASWPFGATLVKDNKIIAQAGSGDGVEESHDPTAHAEVNVIRIACRKLVSSNLGGMTLYASCQPCALCIGAAWYAGIRRIVYGSSLEDIRSIGALWGGDLAFPDDRLYTTGIEFKGGVLRQEVMKLYSMHPRVRGCGK